MIKAQGKPELRKGRKQSDEGVMGGGGGSGEEGGGLRGLNRSLRGVI